MTRQTKTPAAKAVGVKSIFALVSITTPRSRIIMCTSTNSGLSDDDIYNIVKAVWENRDEWAGCAKSVQTQTVLDTVLEEIAIPMHPGAIRYFEEIGIKVPDNLK